MKSITLSICICIVLLLQKSIVGTAFGTEFRTHDPLKAFLHADYPLGDDYFINGIRDTHVFRCILSKDNGGFEGIALSEISIWGNRTGPWELFKKTDAGEYIYLGTKYLADTSCLESCRSKEYLISRQCQWRRGWPKP